MATPDANNFWLKGRNEYKSRRGFISLKDRNIEEEGCKVVTSCQYFVLDKALF